VANLLGGSATGKCSHGGIEDESRTRIAKCGINKDSVLEEWSPHHHLHFTAYSAAVNYASYVMKKIYTAVKPIGLRHEYGYFCIFSFDDSK
jgi:hypothetical protein